MPSTMVIKPKPVEAARKSVPVRATSGTETESRDSAVRKGRASSWTRRARDLNLNLNLRATTEPQGSMSKPSCGRRARSTSTAPKPTENGSRNDPNHRRVASCARRAAADPKPRDPTGCPGQRERGRTEPKVPIQSNKAFTIIPPNPKKRREIQKKAEAELAALEELRLSKAMSYVSINPSSVGGCLSLEEVRLKQQQEMMQAKRKHKQIKKQVMKETPVLTR